MCPDVVIDAKNVKFCCGPCCSVDFEPEPINISSEPYHCYKPHSGGRYQQFIWPLSNGGSVSVINLRVCHGCFSRYNDDDFDTDDRIRDGCVVMKKLKDFIKE